MIWGLSNESDVLGSFMRMNTSDQQKSVQHVEKLTELAQFVYKNKNDIPLTWAITNLEFSPHY